MATAPNLGADVRPQLPKQARGARRTSGPPTPEPGGGSRWPHFLPAPSLVSWSHSRASLGAWWPPPARLVSAAPSRVKVPRWCPTVFPSPSARPDSSLPRLSRWTQKREGGWTWDLSRPPSPLGGPPSPILISSPPPTHPYPLSPCLRDE